MKSWVRGTALMVAWVLGGFGTPAHARETALEQETAALVDSFLVISDLVGRGIRPSVQIRKASTHADELWRPSQLRFEPFLQALKHALLRRELLPDDVDRTPVEMQERSLLSACEAAGTDLLIAIGATSKGEDVVEVQLAVAAHEPGAVWMNRIHLPAPAGTRELNARLAMVVPATLAALLGLLLLRRRHARPAAAPAAAAPAALAETQAWPAQRYRPIRELGRGAMGVVQLAHDTFLDRPVALKLISEELRSTDGMTELFMREARALAALQHPHIVTVYDVGHAGGTLFMAMEYVEGSTLDRVLEEHGPLPPPEAFDILLPICLAIDYAHTQRVIHRDLKPANILVTASGSKIMDFGLGRLMHQAVISKTAVAGTPYFMAPEQLKGQDIDFRADIYGMAVTIYQTLTGQVPFPGDSVIWDHLHTPPPPMSAQFEHLAPFDPPILKALSKDKGDRFATMRELHDALVAAAH